MAKLIERSLLDEDSLVLEEEVVDIVEPEYVATKQFDIFAILENVRLCSRRFTEALRLRRRRRECSATTSSASS